MSDNTSGHATPMKRNSWRPLQEYFTSGWAFFLPYLAAYLLYAWLDWPVNPAGGGPGTVVPCLLHVYWTLHALHLALAVIALQSWWFNATGLRSPASSLRTAVPWILLGLLFWIPGIYLEWPSDPWEHLRRINEWHIIDTVDAHSTWRKFSYFFPYSTTHQLTGLEQLSALSVYYTSTCLLLAYQYFRLARSLSLGVPASLVFTFLSALLFGNNIFSFYRYYGLSSSLVSQIVSIALIRAAVELASGNSSPRCWLHAGMVAVLGLLIIFFTHPQGLGITALGCISVSAWKLFSSYRRTAMLLAGAAIVISGALILTAFHSPALAEIRRAGWLAPWGGLNLFVPSSPAFNHAAPILGGIGILNLTAGAWLIRKRHLVGYLTLMPLFILSLPHAAIPLVLLLEGDSSGSKGVFLFQRLLFAVPTCLAIVVVGESMVARLQSTRPRLLGSMQAAGLAIATAFLASAGCGVSCGARVWHALSRVPDDLALQGHVRDLAALRVQDAGSAESLVLSTKIGRDLVETFSPSPHRSLSRVHVSPISPRLLKDLADAKYFDIHDQTGRSGLPADISMGRRQNSRTSVLINADRPELWTDLMGGIPVFNRSVTGLIVSNLPGTASAPFCSFFVPIDRSDRYRVSGAIRAVGMPSAQNYLAVAWYDKDRRLLLSRLLRPSDPNYPAGWINGDFSYFGIAGRPATDAWRTHSVDFGRGETAEIPAEATFFRIGALLNQDSRPGASTLLSRFVVVTKSAHEAEFLVAPASQRLFSSTSAAGRLSRHWIPEHAATDHAGAPELTFAAASELR